MSDRKIVIEGNADSIDFNAEGYSNMQLILLDLQLAMAMTQRKMQENSRSNIMLASPQQTIKIR
jgi:hypothetical protein